MSVSLLNSPQTTPLKRIRQWLRAPILRRAVLSTWLLAMVSYQVVGHQPRKRLSVSKTRTAATQAQPTTAATVAPTGTQVSGNSNAASISLGRLFTQPPVSTSSRQAATNNR